MPPSSRSLPTRFGQSTISFDLHGIPSLDDIIPWSGEGRKPRQPKVSDAVRTVHGINGVFLENVLKSYFSMIGCNSEVKVRSHTDEPLDTPAIPQRNELCEVNVKAAVDEKIETYHMIIKTLTTSQPVRSLAASHCFDKREAGFYSEILDDINVFQQQMTDDPNERMIVPAAPCFFARFSARSGEAQLIEDYCIPEDESVVVMENVKYQGFTQAHIRGGLSKQQAMTVIEGIARLHGLSLAMKERSGIPLHLSYKYLLCMREVAQCAVKLFDKNMPEVQSVLSAFNKGALGEKLMGMRTCLRQLVELLGRPEEPLSILSHMNLWAPNILLKGEDECVIVDWQMITCTRPTFDMAFLLATSVKSAVRREYETEFLDHYYDRFTTYATRFKLDPEEDLGYSREHLLQDYRFSQLLALFFCVGKSQDILTTREAEELLVDLIVDIDSYGLLTSGLVNFIEMPRHICRPLRNAYRHNFIFEVDPSSSEDDNNEPLGDLFPVYEFPED